MSNLKVTFDSNVWEKIVRKEPNFEVLTNRIIAGEIEPYICEIAVSLESIRKRERLSFWKTYKPKVEIIREDFIDNRVKGTIGFGPDNEAHPGLHPKLKEYLLEACSLGFKVLRMINTGTVRSPEIPEQMKINLSEMDEYWSYADKLDACSTYIESLGAGPYQYFNFKKLYGFNGYSITEIIRELPENLEKKFSDSIAEWVDGDALSAHYAYGNEYFCTQDTGKNAGARSVFFPDNLKKVSNKFKLKVISASELSVL